MSQRIDYAHHAPELTRKLSEMSQHLHATFDHTLVNLVDIRVSQINGCAFCVDMHVKQAKLRGEKELRLYHLPVWRESPLFSARERAALDWAETVTGLAGQGVPEEAYARARAVFDEAELAKLTFAVATINAWNRIAVSFHSVPGSMDALYGLDRASLSG